MGAAGAGRGGRALPGRWALLLLMVFVTLPCYVWYAVQQDLARPAAAAAAASPLTPPPPLPTPLPPYQLLNESEPPPLEELAGLAHDDDGTLVDLRDFRWLLGGAAPARCRPLVLVLVHTALGHTANRALIRETWGSRGLAPHGEVLVRFLVGQPSGADAQAVQGEIAREAATFGDVVQGSFVDAYRNLTYKHAMALKWFATLCPEATYVLKVDDDTLVNTPVLLDYVRNTMSPFGARRLLACTVLEHARPKRTWRSKWRVGFREYRRDEYPTYCAGWAVLFSPDVALALYREVQREPYFWIDDVLVTGVLAERIGVTHASWTDVVLTSDELPRVLAGDLRPTFMVALWYDVGLDMDKHRLLWRRILDDVSAPASVVNTTRVAWGATSS
ncbi:beta-1,3-galactosyltransferase 5 [Frankliniella occidentalis]|uniref:Hexosyltransferase n=1 Tax=Frankliniella occidentalis TaxID=133901 RepID=A0A6J1T0D4_FRAOC|nr:beta-1,3-galactosyltransferase 5 [Frankliniella occidentalis]XP_052124512.1 beta-1,3-galactosyltransferase 5 [Frankliniella occidentalis]